MKPRRTPPPAEDVRTPPVYEWMFADAPSEGAEVDIESIRGALPSAAIARSADLSALHVRTDWGERHFLREFYHENPGMLRESRTILRHLKQTHGRILSLTQILPGTLAQDEFVLEQCCRREKQYDERGLYPPRLRKMSDAFVTAGFIIPETRTLLSEHPADALQLLDESLEWGAQNGKHVRPTLQMLTRFLVVKLLDEGFLESPRCTLPPPALPFEHPVPTNDPPQTEHAIRPGIGA